MIYRGKELHKKRILVLMSYGTKIKYEMISMNFILVTIHISVLRIFGIHPDLLDLLIYVVSCPRL